MFLFGFLRVYHVKTETIVKLCVKNFETASLQELYKNFTLLRPLFFQIISITVQETKICGNGKKKIKIKINENLIDIIDAE